jgi:hypothetical protein
MTLYRTARVLLASAGFLSLAGSAFALDSADLLAKINAAYSRQGGTIAAASIDVDGTTVTLKDTTVKPNSGNSLPIGTVTLSGVAKEDGGGYYIKEVSFPNVNVTEDGTTLTAENLTLGGVSIPADANAAGIDGILLYQTAHSGLVKVAKDGADTLSIGQSDFDMTLRNDKSGFDFDGTIKDLKADLSKAEDEQSRDAIEKLALQHIQGDITTKGAWELGPGTVDVSDFTVDVNNVGKLKLAFNISGYTLDFVKSLQEAMKAAKANATSQQGQQALGLSMLGLMQQLSFAGAQVRFEDASITKRALDYVGSKQNMSGKQLGDSLKAMAPIMVAQLNIPELQNALSAAVATFLDDPKSFTVTAKPDKPVPLPMIVGAAMGAPNTIPQVIGLKVSANN